jgi:mono/diheme cytochrome c family protein
MKRPSRQRIVCAAHVVLCGSLALVEAAWAETASAPSFKKDIQPIFNAQCVFCHITGAENGGLNLGRRDAYRNLVSTKSTESTLLRVAPRDLENSYLIHKLRGSQVAAGGSGDSMPKTDPPRLLDAAQVKLIEKWILDGAADN